MPATALAHREEIIANLSEGKLLRDISANLGVSPAAISQQLASDQEYREARETGAELRLDRWQQEIETAPNALNLARGREAFKAVSWRCEREFPHRWGAKPEIGAALTINIAAAGDVVAVALQSEVPTNPNDRELVIMSNPARAQGVAAAQRAKHIARLASMTPEQLAALVALADRALPESMPSTPTRSPVPPRLVDSEGDK